VRIFFLLVLLLSFPAAAGFTQEPVRRKAKPDEKWVERTLKRMTLDEKVGQLVMVSYFGGFLSAESPEYKELINHVEEKHVGGFIVRTRPGLTGAERSQAYPTAALANQLQRRAKVPLLVAADFERGTAMRLVEGTSFPYAMGVAATGRVEDAYTMGRITAIEARAVGVHCVFAPVADVNVNPENPIINTRSFGEDPKRVSELVAAFVRGVEENGALATAKHFPGHGDTNVDSHVDLPTINGDRARLESVELAPFRAAISAGASTMMTGHLAVPVFEPDADVPATLSPLVLTNLLRGELGFDGLIFTDAMNMGGVTVRYAPGEAAVRAILAGSDMVLMSPAPDAALAAIKQAAVTGRLPISRIDEAVRRVLTAKSVLGLQRQRYVDLDDLNEVFGKPEFVNAAEGIADRGVTLLRDDQQLLPLDATRPQRVLLAAISGDPEVFPGVDLEREIRWRVDQLEVLRVDTRYSRPETVKMPPPDSYDVAIVALFVRVADRKNTVGLPTSQVDLVNKLLAANKPTIVVSFGSPYLVERFPQAKTWLAVFSTFDVTQRAAGRALFGQVAIGGQIPVSVPGVAKPGDGLSVAANPMRLRPASDENAAKLTSAFDVVQQAVANRLLPGAVLAVGHRGELAVRTFGRQSFMGDSPEVSPNAGYDPASRMTPVVTSAAVAILVETGRLQLENPIVRYIPEFASGPNPEWRKKVTPRHLLMHTSGLPPGAALLREAKNWEDALARVLAEPLVSEPGTQFAYSSLGGILLAEVVERLTGKTLDEFAQERIFEPLGTRDLAAFAQMVLNGGIYAHQRVLRRATIDLFAARLPVGGTVRALGWEVGPWNGGPLSRRSMGYDAENGASLWIDPEKELFIIFLPSDVPADAVEQIRALRDPLHKAVVEALSPAPPAPGGTTDRRR